MKSKNIVELRDITKKFGKRICLDRVNLTISEGEFLVIAGANGSGKTLLMKHINGLFPIKRGTLFFRGEDCYKKENLMRSRVGLIFQNPESQIVGLTVREDVEFGPVNLGQPKKAVKEIVDNSIKRMEITHLEERNPHTLSGGELKRVTIAGVLAMEPEVIIFDEPFIGLDYPGVISVTKALIDLHRAGETIVVISHDLEKILKYASRIVVMQGGKIKFNGNPEDSLDTLEDWGVRRPYQNSIEDMSWLK